MIEPISLDTMYSDHWKEWSKVNKLILAHNERESTMRFTSIQPLGKGGDVLKHNDVTDEMEWVNKEADKELSCRSEEIALFEEVNNHLLLCDKWAERMDKFSLGFRWATFLEKQRKLCEEK